MPTPRQDKPSGALPDRRPGRWEGEVGYPVGTRVLVSDPDAGEACFRLAEEGVVTELITFRDPGRPNRFDASRSTGPSTGYLHRIDFPNDVVVNGVNYGKLPVYLTSKEFEVITPTESGAT